MRAPIVLMAAEGATSREVAEKVGLSARSVCKWRHRYLQQGLAGLHDELRPGRPRLILDPEVAALIRESVNAKPKDGTHWTIRSMAKNTRLSRPTVHHIWKAFGLQPHRQHHFRLSPTRSSWKRCAILSACIQILRIRLWCCACTKKAQALDRT